MKEDLAGISIVICTYNGKGKLAPTLQHIAAQKGTENIPVEVLLIDNASTDGTAQFAHNTWQTLNTTIPLTVISEPKAGKANASITGFNVAQYRFILVCDDDNWLCADYVKKAFDIMTSSKTIGVLGGRSEPVFEGTEPEWFNRYARLFAAGPQSTKNGDVTDEIDFLWGAGMVFRKIVWTKLQQINYTFFLNETREGNSNWGGDDVELFEMIRMFGYRIWYDDSLTFKHYTPAGRATYAYLKSRYYGQGRSRVYLQAYLYCRTHDQMPANHLKYPLWLDKWQYKMRQYLKEWPSHLFESKTKVSDEYLKFIALRGELHELMLLKGNYNKVFEKILAIKKVINGQKDLPLE